MQERRGAGHQHYPGDERTNDLSAAAQSTEKDQHQDADAEQRACRGPRALLLDVLQQVGEDHVFAGGVIEFAVHRHLADGGHEGGEVGREFELGVAARGDRRQPAQRAIALPGAVEKRRRHLGDGDSLLRLQLRAHRPQPLRLRGGKLV